MRNLILATLLAVPVGLCFSAAAGTDTDNLFKVLQKNGCATSAPTTATPADAICKATAYDYCARAVDQDQCKRYLGTAPSGGQAYSGPVTDSTYQAVKDKADGIVTSQIEPYERLAKNCCGNSPDECKNQMPAGSAAQTGQQQIARNLVATAADATPSTDEPGVRGRQSASSQNFGYATDAAAGLSGACRSTKAMCQERFTALAKTVKQRAAQVPQGDRANVTQLATDYEARAKACNDLSSALADQNTKMMSDNKAEAEAGKLETASAGSSGQQKTKAAKDDSGLNSNMLMSMLPAMMQMMNQDDDKKKDGDTTSPSTTPTPTAAADCSNPATAGCYQAASQNWATTPAVADGTTQGGATTAGTGYNVPDTGGTKQDGLAMAGTPGTPITVASVPGGGGGFGGGMGGGGSGAGGSAGGGARGASVNTDIMHGEGGGGGLGAMNAAMSTAAGGSSGGYTYGRGANGGEEAAPTVDWRQFLPGGSKDPTRKLAGAATRTEIQSSQVNIWNRVSERIRARCAQGLLRDCN